MPEISIIVPVYKVEKYLDRCITSILNQTFTDFELILVDDGSPDRCGEICEKYAKEDVRIKVIHKSNGGMSDARNRGLDEAKGNFIGFVDSDDYIAPDMYEYLRNIAVKEKADVSMCDLYNCYKGRKIETHPCTYYQVMNGTGAIQCVLESKITGIKVMTKLYRKELFEYLRFKKGIIAEDAEIMIKLLERARRVVITNEQKYYYFYRADSITTKPLNERDYDIVDVYDSIMEHVKKLSPVLEPAALMRQCWARFSVLDKMMLYDGEYDIEKQRQYISFLRKNKMFIFKNDTLTPGRRVAFLLLLINTGWYKYVVRYIKGKNIND